MTDRTSISIDITRDGYRHTATIGEANLAALERMAIEAAAKHGIRVSIWAAKERA